MPPNEFLGVSFNMEQGIHLRLMKHKDITRVMQIQSEAYAEVLQESESVIRARLDVAPETAWVVERDGDVCAYLVAYKSEPGVVSKWGGEFSHKTGALTLYVHDLALGKSAKGLRIGQWLVEQVLSQSRLAGIKTAALVSVQNSQAFWQKLGFTTFSELTPIQQQNLDTYAGNAYYMTRNLT